MGSLMAGWDSTVLDSNSEKCRKNRSLTKEEIEAYWRSRKKAEEEHLKVVSSPPNRTVQEYLDHEVKRRRSSSLPPPSTRDNFMDMEAETNLEKLIKEHGWWTSSNWAFLNEPPVPENASKTYSSQFHVANPQQPKGRF